MPLSCFVRYLFILVVQCVTCRIDVSGIENGSYYTNVGAVVKMFSFKKKSGWTESLFINILIFGTLFSGLVQIIYSTFSSENKLTIKNGGMTLNYSEKFNYTSACGKLGCFPMSNITFLTGENVADWIDGPGNQTANYTDTVTLSCKPARNISSMIYWVGTRHNPKKNLDANFSMDGIFYKKEPADNRYEITLENVTGYEHRWFACILVKDHTAAIAYGFLNVTGDPDPTHYTSERTDKLSSSQTGGISPTISAQAAGLISVGVVFLLSVLTIIGIAMYRRRNNKVIVKYWLKKITIEKPQSEAGDLVLPIVKIEKQKLTQVGIIGNDTTLMSEYQMPVDAEWEIPRSKMSLTGQVLGEGEFGKVVKAEAYGIVEEDAKTVVAIKMLKESYTDADMISLVSEMEIMKLIGKHENIINLLGCCTQDGPLYVVVEYAENGCLRDYLKRHKPHKNNASTENLLKKPLTQRELMDFVWQVVKGMAYLASRGCIHRDLAARNVLVSADMVLKIADFGLARDVRDSEYYRKITSGKLPVKWMAPESMAQQYYDKRSDVWSFGILAWEIMTYGCTPYPKVHHNDLYRHLKNGKRMEKPDDCSTDMYDMMMGCWAFKPEDRPTFEDLVENMNTILNISKNPPPPGNQNDYVTMLA